MNEPPAPIPPARSRARRALWCMTWTLLFRPSPRIAFAWRRGLLRLFGAQIGAGAHVYPTCRIWAPWHLRIYEHGCLGDYVDCYSVDRIVVGPHAVVSQYAFLCTASHDIQDPAFPLVTRPISIGARVWIGAGAYVGPGITLGEGAVAAARAVVVKDVPPWTVVGGNPAQFIKHRREPRDSAGSHEQ